MAAASMAKPEFISLDLEEYFKHMEDSLNGGNCDYVKEIQRGQHPEGMHQRPDASRYRRTAARDRREGHVHHHLGPLEVQRGIA